MTALAACSDPSAAKQTRRAIEVHGEADLSFAQRDGVTSPGRIYYSDPLKFLFPQGDVSTAALLTTGGGLLGGDRYDVSVHLEERAQSLVTVQAAEKVYRTSGPDCTFNVNLRVDNDACLEWLPQETILFDEARFRRTTTIDIEGTGSALVGEIIVFGRLARGEELQSGLIRDAWDIRKDGKRLWADALHMEGDVQQQLNHPSAFDGARAMATAVFIGPDAPVLMDPARDLIGEYEQVRCGATCVNGLLVCRWLAQDPYDLRKAFGGFWTAFRHIALGRQASLPRLWHC